MKVLDAYIKDGTPDPRKDSDYNPKELAAGIEVEKEHTDCPIKAKIIAKDHLDEIEDYYTRLIKMEEDAKYQDDYFAEDEELDDDSLEPDDDLIFDDDDDDYFMYNK